MAVLLPSAVKFTHLFQNHEHPICIDAESIHFHQTDFECDFLKYKLTNGIAFEPLAEEPLAFQRPLDNNFSVYTFLSNHQKLHFELRGPPAVV